MCTLGVRNFSFSKTFKYVLNKKLKKVIIEALIIIITITTMILGKKGKKNIEKRAVIIAMNKITRSQQNNANIDKNYQNSDNDNLENRNLEWW